MGPAGLKALRILWSIIISSQKRAGQEYNLRPKLYKALWGENFFWVCILYYSILFFFIIFYHIFYDIF